MSVFITHLLMKEYPEVGFSVQAASRDICKLIKTFFSVTRIIKNNQFWKGTCEHFTASQWRQIKKKN